MAPVKYDGNLHRKLLRFRAEFGAVEKTGKNKSQGYGFAEAAVIGKRAVELMTEIGLTCVPVGASIPDIRESASGKQNVYTVAVDWQITDVETGEFIVVPSFGQGADANDKGVPKALSNAMKYAMLTLLQAVAEDPEADEETDRPARRSRRQRDESEGAEEESRDLAPAGLKRKIRAHAREVGLTDEQLKALAYHTTGKRSSTQWTTHEAEKVLSRLDNDSYVDSFRELEKEAAS